MSSNRRFWLALGALVMSGCSQCGGTPAAAPVRTPVAAAAPGSAVSPSSAPKAVAIAGPQNWVYRDGTTQQVATLHLQYLPAEKRTVFFIDVLCDEAIQCPQDLTTFTDALANERARPLYEYAVAHGLYAAAYLKAQGVTDVGVMFARRTSGTVKGGLFPTSRPIAELEAQFSSDAH